jgi:hypothetical protein
MTAVFVNRFRRELALPAHASLAVLTADALAAHCQGAPTLGSALDAGSVLAQRHPASFHMFSEAARAYAAMHTAIKPADWLALVSRIGPNLRLCAGAKETLAAFAGATGMPAATTNTMTVALAARYLACHVENWTELVPALYAADAYGPRPSAVLHSSIVQWRAARPAVDARVLNDALAAWTEPV